MSAEKSFGLGYLLLCYFFTVVWGLLTAVKILWEIIKHPVESFKKTERNKIPNCLQDPTYGSHEYVRANGIKFHCVHSGDREKPLMLLLHGFPEFWYSWRYQITAFNKHFHVVAIDLRGYGETERPLKKSDYTLSKLREDIAQLIPALGYSKCVLVGHDWGGVISWSVAHKYPDAVEKLIIMNCPHYKVMVGALKGTWAQFLKSWYMFMFQIPMLPELAYSLRDYSFFNAIFRSRKVGVRHRENFTSEAVEVYKYIFSKPGALTAPINYIRCIFNSDHEKDTPLTPISTPTLLIWGDKDGFLEKSMADAHEDLVTNLTVKHLPDCSHWVQQDLPDKVNELMKDFLEL